MGLYVFEPDSVSDWHGGYSCVKDGLMVELGTVGFVGVDLCRSPAERGSVLAMKYSEKILDREAALWIHTGLHTLPLTRKISVARSICADDVVVRGGQKLTNIERTAIDLLIDGEEHGIEYLCALIRAGSNVAAVERLARQRSLAGIVRVRKILRQLPRNLGTPNSFPSR